LLGRHVRGGAEYLEPRATATRRRLAYEAEVEDHDATLARDDDVRWLEIAVHRTRAMQRIESRRELANRIAQPHLRRRRIVGLARAIAHPVEERPALHELHREEPVTVIVKQLAEAHEVAMLEIHASAELRLQAIQRLRIELTHRLERDEHPALVIERLVHDPHRTFAENSTKLEATIAGEVLPGQIIWVSRIRQASRRGHRDHSARRTWFRGPVRFVRALTRRSTRYVRVVHARSTRDVPVGDRRCVGYTECERPRVVHHREDNERDRPSCQQ
jgi:hypothetical protein